jgi:hypothetical protein
MALLVLPPPQPASSSKQTDAERIRRMELPDE